MADDTVNIRIRARGGRQAGRDADLAAAGVGRIGRAARGSAGGVRMLGSVTASTNRGLRITSGLALSGGAAIAGLGAIAAKSGLMFNASMEQNEIAFTQFLGSAEKARAELGFLQRTAANTPFELPQITKASRQLLAFGFPLKQANGLLLTLGDAAAGAGLGAEAIDQMVRAVGQIRSKGTLQAEELQQLGELGIVDRGKLAKNLGVTTAQLADAGNQGIKSSRAIAALKKTLDDSFGGQSAKQAKTFNGQLSTLHDNLNMTLGTITRPAFNALKDRVFPVLGRTGDAINKTFSRKDLDFGEKVHVSEDIARRNLSPLVRVARAELGQMHLGDKLADGFEAAVPRLADTAGRAAPKIASGLVNGFINAGPYGKMFALGLIAKKLGVFTIAGRAAAGRFAGGFAEGGGGLPGGAGGAGGKAGKAGRFARVLPWLGPAGLAIGAGLVGGKLAGDALHDTSIGRGARRLTGNDPESIGAASEKRLRSQGRVPVDLGGGVIVWEKPGDARHERARARRGPAARGSTVHHTTIVKVRDREIGRATDRYVADETARNRRPR